MAEVKQITRGLDEIALAPMIDKGPGTVFAPLGLTDRDSPVTMLEEDPTSNDLFSHELDPAIDSMKTKGATQMLWTIVDPDLDTLVAVFGGSKTGTGATAVYNQPSQMLVKEQTLRITPKKGYIITPTRCNVYGKINGDFAAEGKLAIDMVADILAPYDDTDPFIKWGPVVTP